MKADVFLKDLEQLGVETITGVPDSTLKAFCDGLQQYHGKLKHYVPVNEGAAVGIAVGSYLASGRPACVYMQNSGIGNTVNPVASLANREVYGIPMLFLIGWRGEPGVKDEPQHAFQGKVTCTLLDTMTIPYAVVDVHTTRAEMDAIWQKAKAALADREQYAIVVKKGTFEQEEPFSWENGNHMVREQVLGELIRVIPEDVCIVSTTGKISRELYEQSNRIRGKHDALFMTVGGMGHASMIAFGIAQNRKDKKIVCVDGDGAALMHMGALPFLAEQAPENFYHVVINNQAHESVGAMPTGCQHVQFAELARAAGYKYAEKITELSEISRIGQDLAEKSGPGLYEIPVMLESRADLCRPSETADKNREMFMEWLER